MGLLLCSLSFFNQLFPDEGITQIQVRLKDATDEQKIITALTSRLHLEVYSWKDMYPALVAALKLEKYVMFFILALITLVASMNIVSLLFMYITYKRGDIAILKALGVPNATIQQLFILIGMGISLVATISGLFTAFIVCLLLRRYPFISLPDTYYVSHLPVSLDVSTFILVFIVIMTISFCATVYSAKKSNAIVIAHVLKGEV